MMHRLLVLFLASLLAVNAPATHRVRHTTKGNTKAKAKKLASPCPHVKTITDCPAEGCGGDFDPALNKQKNIPSDDQEPALRSIEWMKNLPNPSQFTAKNRDRSELKQLGEGQKITVVALALAARKGGQESCNCKLKAKADTDNHIVLVDPNIEDPSLEENEKLDSETAEFTPRVRLTHPNLTQENLEPLIDREWKPGETPSQGARLVRVTGVLMFDSEHFLRNPLKRHNNWEVHPVLKMEYCPDDKTCDETSDENWIDLDGG
jgi:hypothetical protein